MNAAPGKKALPVSHQTAPVLALTVLVLNFLLYHIDTAVLGEGETVFLTVALMQVLILFLPALLYIRIRQIPISELRLRFSSVRTFRFPIAVTLFLITGGTLLAFFLSVFGISVTQSSAYSEFIPEGLSSRAIFIALAFAIVPAVMEEFVFRSVLLCEYEPAGMRTAILLSGLLYGLVHLSPAGLPVYWFSGIVLAFSAFVTRSVFVPILIRILQNLYILFLQDYVVALFETPQDTVFLLLIIAALFLLSLFFVLSQGERLLRINGERNLDADAPYLPKNRTIPVARAWMSPSLLTCIAAFLVLIFLR